VTATRESEKRVEEKIVTHSAPQTGHRQGIITLLAHGLPDLLAPAPFGLFRAHAEVFLEALPEAERRGVSVEFPVSVPAEMADQEFREASRQDVTVMFTAFREERGGIEERGKIQVADKRQEPLGLGVDRPARPRLLQVDREALLAWNIGGAKEFQRAENRWPSSWRTTSCSASGLSVVSTIEVEAYSASPPSLRPNVASRSRCQRNTRTLSRCRSVSPNQPASSSITDSQSRSNSGTSSLFASSGKKWMTTLWARWGVESSSSSGKAPKPEPRGLPATACKEKNRQRPHCHLNTYKKDPLENRQHEPEKNGTLEDHQEREGSQPPFGPKQTLGLIHHS
jgi:hypothetical protein